MSCFLIFGALPIFSESLSAGQLKTLLNDFFTPITGIIFDHNGTIDKYVGDMVMAFWGAPLDDSDHRLHAVQAALKMLEKVEELKVEFKERGFPEVNIGIGINSGFMNVAIWALPIVVPIPFWGML